MLYSTGRKEASIVHLCIEPSQRNKGVAKALFSKLKEITKASCRGVRVRCRRDYNLNNVWEQLGFTSIDEMPGRSRQGTILTIWWFDHQHPTLFTLSEQQRTQSKLKAVIDANIFYELNAPLESADQESQSLLADWLQEDVELCITSEIFNEINRCKDKSERKRARKFAHTFVILEGPDDKFQEYCAKLRGFFPEQMSDNDASDLRHLAKSIAVDILFFVTHDKALLKKTEKIQDDFGIRIINPSTLVIYQDELMRETEYQPARLANPQIQIERVHSERISSLTSLFHSSRGGETKAAFQQRLRTCLADPHSFETKTLLEAGRILALIVYDRKNPHELEIPLFRLVSDSSLAATLARYFVLQAVLTSSREKRILTRITDTFLSDVIRDALKENGFVPSDDIWIKANLPVVEKAEDLALRLVSLTGELPGSIQHFKKNAEALKNAVSIHDERILLEIEQSLWPAKIADIDIPAFIVSIKPEWAMQLFDFGIADQDLFGGKEHLLLNSENVYYRHATHTKIISTPARVLWYISQGKNYQDTKSIRACSYIDEVMIDKPKPLFSKFRRLGTYEWKNVLEVAGGNIEQDIMAFRFSRTELFDSPVHRDELQAIWQAEEGCNFNILAPVAISCRRFLQLYQKGFANR